MRGGCPGWIGVADIGSDIGEVLADAVRRVMAPGRRGPVGLGFDTHLPSGCVRGDPVKLQRGLHRMLDGAWDLLTDGLVLCEAQGARGPRRLHLTVLIVGTGLPARPAEADAMLERLALKPLDASAGKRPVRAYGRCPYTGADVSFSSLPGEGFVLRFRHALPFDGDGEEQTPPDAGGAHAWVIDAEAAPAHMLARRLQRLGWTTSTFRSAAQALARLQQLWQVRPALVIGVESEAVDAGGLHRLGELMPEASRRVLGVVAGSPAPRRFDRPGVDIQAVPFSACDLARFTAGRAHSAQAPSGRARPVPQRLAEACTDAGCE